MEVSTLVNRALFDRNTSQTHRSSSLLTSTRTLVLMPSRLEIWEQGVGDRRQVQAGRTRKEHPLLRRQQRHRIRVFHRMAMQLTSELRLLLAVEIRPHRLTNASRVIRRLRKVGEAVTGSLGGTENEARGTLPHLGGTSAETGRQFQKVLCGSCPPCRVLQLSMVSWRKIDCGLLSHPLITRTRILWCRSEIQNR